MIERRLRLLSEKAPVKIYIKDMERRYVLANKVAHELAGVAPGEMIDQTDEDFMSPAAAKLSAESDRQVLEGERSEVVEKVVVGGRERVVVDVRFPFLDEGSGTIGLAGISTDITSQRLAEALREELTRAEGAAIERLRDSYQETVERLALATEARDVDTGLHVARMATITAFLGAKLGLDDDRVILLRAAAPMHDVGKISPDEILMKPGPLTGDERAVMQRHTTVGHQVLADSTSELLQMGARIALTHHERWDGDGYPSGLKEDEIPIEGRVAAVADVFDALLSDRSYRPAMTLDEAVTLIRDGRETISTQRWWTCCSKTSTRSSRSVADSGAVPTVHAAESAVGFQPASAARGAG